MVKSAERVGQDLFSRIVCVLDRLGLEPLDSLVLAYFLGRKDKTVCSISFR